jgi:hypothetical protein
MNGEKPKKRLVGWTRYVMTLLDKGLGYSAAPDQLLRAVQETARTSNCPRWEVPECAHWSDGFTGSTEGRR